MKKLTVSIGALAVIALLLAFSGTLFKFEEFSDELSTDAPYSSIEPLLSIGDIAPNFSLTDQAGKRYELAQYRNNSHVMLVFYRGSWCPFCVSHLEDIQNLFPTLDKYNVQMLAISGEPDRKSSKLAKKFNVPYVFLSDPDLEATMSYGIRNDKDLPHPAVFLIDTSGKLIWYHIDQDYKKRASALQLKAVLESLLNTGN